MHPRILFYNPLTHQNLQVLHLLLGPMDVSAAFAVGYPLEAARDFQM